MNTESVAKIMDGVEYSHEYDRVPPEAKEHGIVVVFGASDDLLEFRGAIQDEYGSYGGTKVKLDNSGVIENKCDDDACPYFIEKYEKAFFEVEAVWAENPVDPPWTIRSNIPHHAFNVMEEGEVWCRGIVFNKSSLIPKDQEVES